MVHCSITMPPTCCTPPLLYPPPPQGEKFHGGEAAEENVGLFSKGKFWTPPVVPPLLYWGEGDIKNTKSMKKHTHVTILYQFRSGFPYLLWIPFFLILPLIAGFLTFSCRIDVTVFIPAARHLRCLWRQGQDHGFVPLFRY